jgi:transposase
MRSNAAQLPSDEIVYLGIDLHRKRWHVTIRTTGVELFSAGIPGTWEALEHLLGPYRGHPIEAVYEAGYFGYWLHDRLAEYGAGCVVTPPSLIPHEPANRVKTDRRDSRRLAHLLAKGMLKRVWVASPREREERQVVRRRRQLIRDRVRAQNRIKAELRFYGVELPEPRAPWRRVYVENLRRLRLPSRWAQESFTRLLEQYEFLTGQVEKQTRLLRELAQTPAYRERVKILCSVPGVGLIAAMELLLELQDVERFRRADRLAAYVGLTPSQYSSADKVRMGHITGIGKNSLRGGWWRKTRRCGRSTKGSRRGPGRSASSWRWRATCCCG